MLFLPSYCICQEQACNVYPAEATSAQCHRMLDKRLQGGGKYSSAGVERSDVVIILLALMAAVIANN